MKRIVYARTLAALLTIGASSAFAGEELSYAPQSQDHPAQLSVSWLQRQVRSIAQSHELSHAKKEKRIANAVRLAVNTATAYHGGNSSFVISKAVAYATAAARVAPSYSKIITNAASFAPAVARIDGATGQIEAAVDSVGGHGRQPHAVAYREDDIQDTPAPRAKRKHTKLPPAEDVSSENSVDVDANETVTSPPVRQKRHLRTEDADDAPVKVARNDVGVAPVAADPTPDSTAAGEDVPPETPTRHWSAPDIAVGDNASVHLKAKVTAKYDNNIFLSQQNRVSDEIYTFVPGVDFRFGQASTTHGSLSAEESFLRYAQSKAPGAQLASDSGDFGFGNDNLKFTSTGSYQQLYQNDPDTITKGQREIFHSSIVNFDNKIEASIASKMSLGVGFDYYSDSYKNQGLYNNRDLSFPVKIYYAVTPKSDLFAGVTYSDNTVSTATSSAKDLYYNIGARGNFTPKLSGEASIGYKTRSFGGATNDGTLGFDGNLTYELTPKTSSQLSISRGYSTSALGESLTNTRYALNLTTEFSPQWESSLSFSHYDSDYGVTFFDPSLPIGIVRKDHYWEESLTATYIYTSWLSLSGGITYRNNHSTIDQAEFSNVLFSFILGLRY